jgi:hypothetical protein
MRGGGGVTDFNVVDVPAMLAVKVTIQDENGTRPDPDWHREATESLYVFAELLAEEGLLRSGKEGSRNPGLVIKWSDLTSTGQAFVKAHHDKWLRSIDRSGTTEEAKQAKLMRRWKKFAAEQAL